MLKLLFNGKPLVSVAWRIYSKDEVAIGTWIDGRTVYRRVFETMTPSKAGVDELVVEWTDSVTLVSMTGLFKKDEKTILSINKPATYGQANLIYTYYTPLRGISMHIGVDSYINGPATIIVEYVKEAAA